MTKKDDKLVRRVQRQHLLLTGKLLSAPYVALHGLPGGSTLVQATKTLTLDPIDSAVAIASYVVCGDCAGIDPCDVTIVGNRRATITLNPSDHHRH